MAAARAVRVTKRSTNRDGKCKEGKRRLYKHVKKLKAVEGPSPCNGKGPMHICNGASVAVVKRAFCKFENAVAPRKNQKLANKCAPKRNSSAKIAPRITQKHACIAKGRGLPKTKINGHERSMSKSCCGPIKSGMHQDHRYR